MKEDGEHRVPAVAVLSPAPAAPTASADRAGRGRSAARRLIGLGIGLAVVVATFVFVLPQVADYGDVWDLVKDLSWREIALLVGATLVNLSTFAPSWTAALPGLRLRQAFVL